MLSLNDIHNEVDFTRYDAIYENGHVSSFDSKWQMESFIKQYPDGLVRVEKRDIHVATTTYRSIVDIDLS